MHTVLPKGTNGGFEAITRRAQLLVGMRIPASFSVTRPSLQVMSSISPEFTTGRKATRPIASPTVSASLTCETNLDKCFTEFCLRKIRPYSATCFRKMISLYLQDREKKIKPTKTIAAPELSVSVGPVTFVSTLTLSSGEPRTRFRFIVPTAHKTPQSSI